MNCNECGKNLPTNLDYCPTCQVNKNLKNEQHSLMEDSVVEQPESSLDSVVENQNASESLSEPEYESSIYSFLLSAIPYLIFIFGWGLKMDEHGLFTGMLFFGVGVPTMISALVLGIVGWKSKYRIFSYLGVFLALVPLILLFLLQTTDLGCVFWKCN